VVQESLGGMPSTKCAPPDRLTIAEVSQERERLSGHICSSYFDFFPLPLIVINSHRQIVFSNKAFLNVLGLDELGDFLGRRPGEAMGCLYSNVEKSGCGTSEYCRECGALKAVLESMLNGSKTQHDCQLLLKCGEETDARDLRIYVSPWEVEGEKYYVVTIVDIADEKRRSILERIFFHDILNAAGGAKGLIDLLMEESSEESKELISLVQASIFGLVDEIKKQKQLLAVERKEYTPSFVTLKGLELVRLVASEYRLHPVAVNKTIAVGQDSRDVSVYSDYTLLMRVLVNMMINALEASKEGDVVRIGVNDADSHACFWVSNGKVIPEDVKVQIFKRSFSTKGKDRGLGTYSIKLLTENYLNGETGFSSQSPDGTVFWVKIKKAQADDGKG